MTFLSSLFADNSLLSETALAGLGLGIVQGFGGFEHTACVLPLMTKDLKQNMAVSIVWGMSHSFGVLGLTLGLFALKHLTGLSIVQKVADSLFGVSLVLIGTWALLKTSCNHDHNPSETASLLESGKAHQPRLVAACSTGVLHGLSGCGCVFAVLPAAALGTWKFLGVYASAFSIGTILGSIGFGFALTAVASRLVAFAGSLISIIVGLGWIAHVVIEH